MNTLKTLIGASGLIIALGGWSAANAATYTFNFSSNSDSDGSPGNTRNFTDTSNTLSVAAKGWYLDSASDTSPAQASLGLYTTNGLGVKNTTNNDDAHYVDNRGRIDFVSFAFSNSKGGAAQNVSITSITLTIWDTDSSSQTRKDADITLGYGGVAGDLGTILDHYTQDPSNNASSVTYNFQSMPSDDVWRVFASLQNSDGKTDGFKIQSMTVSTVPLPAAVWLFGSALLGMVGIGYRRQNQNKPI